MAGNQVALYGLIILLVDRGSPAVYLALLHLLQIVPRILLSPIAGTIVDRYPRRRILIICDLINGVVAIAVAVTLLGFASWPALTLGTIVAMTLIYSVSGAFHVPSARSIIPQLVQPEDHQRANALLSSNRTVAALGGRGLSGVLYAAVGAPFLFLIDGLSYLFCAAAEAGIEISSPIVDDARPLGLQAVLNDLREGLRFLRSNDGLFHLLRYMVVANFFSAPFLLLFPIYVKGTLGLSVEWQGYFAAAFTVGTVVGNAIAARIDRARLTGMGTATLFLLEALLFLVLAFAPGIATALSAFCGYAILVSIFQIHYLSQMHRVVPEGLMGKLFGVEFAVTMGGISLGAMVFGCFSDAYFGGDVLPIYRLCSGVCLCLSLWLVLDRRPARFFAHRTSSAASSS